MSENGEIYTAGKNFTLPPALTAWTNSTSGLIALSDGNVDGNDSNDLMVMISTTLLLAWS